MSDQNENRQKYGKMGKPIPATRVLVKELDSSHFRGKESYALIAINDREGAFTAMNVYGGELGKRFDPQYYTHPLPGEDSEKWKKWDKKGYEEGNVSDFDVLEDISEDAEIQSEESEEESELEV